MPFDEATIRTARRHLRRRDPVLKRTIDVVGPFTLRPERNRFGMLVRSIIAQQISVSAARSIRSRLEALVAPHKIKPEILQDLSTEQLRSVGLSQQKVRYLRDLSEKAADGTLALRTLGRLEDEAVIAKLTQVKGIGRWTAQMFLIFALQRPDVFPGDDLGIRIALRDNYRLEDLPTRAQGEQIAEPWRPYASIASWYCWRSRDLQTQAKAKPEGFPS